MMRFLVLFPVPRSFCGNSRRFRFLVCVFGTAFSTFVVLFREPSHRIKVLRRSLSFGCYANIMADCDDATRRALVELNMHCITKEMFASHIVMFMNSMAGRNTYVTV